MGPRQGPLAWMRPLPAWGWLLQLSDHEVPVLQQGYLLEVVQVQQPLQGLELEVSAGLRHSHS